MSIDTSSPVFESAENENVEFDNDHYWKTLSIYTMTDDSFAKAIASLDKEQRAVFDQIVSHIQVQLSFDSTSVLPRPDPLFLFVTGPGGTGKSFLISIIYEYLLRSALHNAVSVIKTAPTGVAAHNIKGVTLHKAFYLPVTRKKNDINEYTGLSSESLNELQQFYKCL